ncbi:MAG: hypothetical protein AAGM67_10015, partial [Bacteroidota bacterium]
IAGARMACWGLRIVIALWPGETKKSFFQNRVFTVPQSGGKTKAAITVRMSKSSTTTSTIRPPIVI